MGIANIHVMRKALKGMSQSCMTGSWRKSSEKWLSYISLILHCSNDIVTKLGKGESALVHCSDGWDRTPQLTSVSAIMLDKHYRTIEGFAALIQREWVASGHKFKDRCRGMHSSRESSPIFLQFLDCVWQLLQQHPEAFEFSSRLLEFLAFHAYSGWFLNFSENCVRDSGSVGNGLCLWTCVFSSKSYFLNRSYECVGQNSEAQVARTCEVMRNHCSQDSIKMICKYGLASSSVG